ncbi:hypothetical protein OAY17_03690 [Acidimicrobiia bacterium]|nr:hypothetical protein [Acidimicrobiia bacterium]
MISIFTTMTNPNERNDPWEESLECYNDFADEVVIVGKEWPQDFSWDYIGKTFQKGFDKSKGDWVVWMDLDNMIHQDDFQYITKLLYKNMDQPAVAFPMHQIFTPDRYCMKTIKCLALNKKKFPLIKLNGGGDLCLPTINNKLINVKDITISKKPIWNYDTVFRTREIIEADRLRFAKAWFTYFGDWGDRGGPSEQEAFDAWYKMVSDRYKKHYFRLKIDDHPRYIKDKIANLTPEQFGYDGFGLKSATKVSFKHKLVAIKNRLYYTI